jgi:hypothetical protein
MDKVSRVLLRPVDTTDWAERPKLFVDIFGGWNAMEYMGWVERGKKKYLDQLSKKRGHRIVIITDQDDFTEFLKREASPVG